MAIQAATSYILDTFLAMLFHHLILLMTSKTIHGRVGAFVAIRALPIRIAMTHGEGMTIHADITPIVGIVALRALT
jgi:hypothetical protein